MSLFKDSFDLPNPGLRSYFRNVVAGNPVEYRTPFFKGQPLEEILARWDEHLSKIKDKWPTLYEFEVDLGKKVGPMSIMKPLKQRMSDIDSYYESILLDSAPIDSAAVRAVCEEFKDAPLITLRSEADTVYKMKKSTNSGSPYFTKRRNVTKSTIPVMIFSNSSYTLRGVDWRYCAVLGWRGQEGGLNYDDVKQRVVWMFPYGVNIEELRLYQPAIEITQAHNIIPAYVSMDAVDEAITKLFDTKAKNDLIVCTDFSKFDQHFNANMQFAAKAILETITRPDTEMSYWLEKVFPIKYNIPLAYNWNRVRTGPHGMGSGSGGTNFDESLAHKALQYECALSHGADLNSNSQCLGDDGILSYPGITVDDVVKSYTRHGQEMNVDKQYASAVDCVYLRRWHHTDYRINDRCVGVYSTNRALGRLCEQERYYDPEEWGPKMVALRQISILENVKFHPLREEFAEFCMKGDKYRLGIDIPGFLDGIESIAQEAIDHMPDFLGYTKTLSVTNPAAGISNWWIVQWLKSKA